MMLIMRSLCRQLLGILCSRRTSVRAGRKLGQAKVAQLDVAAAVKEDVGWLEVAAAVATRQSECLLHDPTPEPAQASNGNRTACMAWHAEGGGGGMPVDDALRVDVGQAAQALPHHAPGQQVIQGPLIQGLAQRARAVLHLYVQHLLLAWRRKRGRNTCTVSTESFCCSSTCSTSSGCHHMSLHPLNTSRQRKHLQTAA